MFSLLRHTKKGGKPPDAVPPSLSLCLTAYTPKQLAAATMLTITPRTRNKRRNVSLVFLVIILTL